MQIDFITATKVGEVATRLEMRSFGKRVALAQIFTDLIRESILVEDVNDRDFQSSKFLSLNSVVNTVQSQTRCQFLPAQALEL